MPCAVETTPLALWRELSSFLCVSVSVAAVRRLQCAFSAPARAALLPERTSENDRLINLSVLAVCGKLSEKNTFCEPIQAGLRAAEPAPPTLHIAGMAALDFYDGNVRPLLLRSLLHTLPLDGAQ